MTDKKLVKDQIAGIKANIKALRGSRDAFIETKGMQEEEERLRAEAIKVREEATFLKNSNKKMQEKKNTIISSSVRPLADKISSLLPEGKAIVIVSEDGDFFIGWQKVPATYVIPYNALSGGEKVTFDAALAAALKASVVVCEFAELDTTRLTSILDKSWGDIQTIVLSCHKPSKIPEGWEVINLGT